MAKTRTEEEKRQWREKMSGLAKRIAGMTPEERGAMARKYPIITCEGRALSFHNNCMLLFQSPVTPTMVAGFRQWKKADRQVRKGEHSIGVIYVPLGEKDKETGLSTPATGEDIRFALVAMFDITQTEPVGQPQQAQTVLA